MGFLFMPLQTAAAYFPIVRLVSSPIARWLIRLPISANMVTMASLLSGLGSCYLFAMGDYASILQGSFLFLLCYVLDNLDGEVARAKDQCTDLGDKCDTFVDWLVHSLFFVALGYGSAVKFGDSSWIWLGLSGAIGGTINYLIGLFEAPSSEMGAVAAEEPKTPNGPAQWIAFVLRELFRADFCFIVLILAVVGATEILLPLAAVGAHIYWMTRFIKGVKEFHV
jgi:phosphatidylglycerophosphate synthase